MILNAGLMLGGLGLFIVNWKWTRIALACLIPVVILVSYFGGADVMSICASAVGVAVLAAAPVLEALAARLLPEDDEVPADGSTEDDILDNKKKWRIIVAGYVFFILFALFSVAAIIRLNAKINTIYGFTQDLDKRIEDVSGTKK